MVSSNKGTNIPEINNMNKIIFYKIHFRFILCLLNKNNAIVKNSNIPKDKTGEKLELPVMAPFRMSAP